MGGRSLALALPLVAPVAAAPPEKTATNFLTGGGQITNGDYMVSFAGNSRYMEDNPVGQWETNFHNVSADDLDGASFHSTSITDLAFYMNNVLAPTPADANVVHLVAEGRLNGEEGYTLNVWLADRGEPGKMIDAIWMALSYGATELYRTLPDFPDDAPGPATLLTHGNFQIHVIFK